MARRAARYMRNCRSVAEMRTSDLIDGFEKFGALVSWASAFRTVACSQDLTIRLISAMNSATLADLRIDATSLAAATLDVNTEVEICMQAGHEEKCLTVHDLRTHVLIHLEQYVERFAGDIDAFPTMVMDGTGRMLYAVLEFGDGSTIKVPNRKSVQMFDVPFDQRRSWALAISRHIGSDGWSALNLKAPTIARNCLVHRL